MSCAGPSRSRRQPSRVTLTRPEVSKVVVARFVSEFMAERANVSGGGSGGSGSGGRAVVNNDGGDGEANDDEVSGRGARARREDA